MKKKLLCLVSLTLTVLPLAGIFGCSSNVAKTDQPAVNEPKTPGTTPGITRSANNDRLKPSRGVAEPLEPIEETNRIRFATGESSATISGAVIRGERMTYFLGAQKGQTMSVNVDSPEKNAVFQIEGPSGRYLPGAGERDDAMDWSGTLPRDGDYKIVVGGTRGNATFELKVSIQ